MMNILKFCALIILSRVLRGGTMIENLLQKLIVIFHAAPIARHGSDVPFWTKRGRVF